MINDPDRSSLVLFYFGSFMWMDLRVLLLILQSIIKELDGSPTNAKQVFNEKIKIQLAVTSDAATLYQLCHEV